MNKNQKYIIHVTDVGKCLRALQYRLLGFEEARQHAFLLKGELIHKLLEMVQNKEVTLPDIPSKANLDYDKYRTMIIECFRNLYDWVLYTKILREFEGIEVEFERPIIGNVFVLCGKADLVTKNWIVDFKTSYPPIKRTLKYRMQLSAYRYGLNAQHKRCMNVFLRGDTPTEIRYTEDELKDGFRIFLKKLEDTVLALTSVISDPNVWLPCKISFDCVFCEYRHICVGL